MTTTLEILDIAGATLRDMANGWPKRELLQDPIVTAQKLGEVRGELFERSLEGRVVCLENGTFLSVIRFDITRGPESWAWHAVLAVQGPIPNAEDDPNAYDVDGILRAVSKVLPIQSEGGSGAGRPFSEAPWVQFHGRQVRTLWISQSGGLDV